MTEDEAKTKWCPFVRVTGAGNATDTEWHTNRPSHLEVSDKHFDRCIGSACMAWRATDNEGGPIEPGKPLPPMKPAGYCGLAGKPYP